MAYTTKLTSLIKLLKRFQSKSEGKVPEALPSGGGQGPSQVPASSYNYTDRGELPGWED